VVATTIVAEVVGNDAGTNSGSANSNRGREATERPNSEANMKVAKPPIFSREVRNIAGFITVYKLFLRIKMRVVVEEQI